VDLAGQPLSLDYRLGSLANIAMAMDRRQKFVAAGSLELALEILRSLDLGDAAPG
jgi:myo-inositol-1(or 4)-monophosphatase